MFSVPLIFLEPSDLKKQKTKTKQTQLSECFESLKEQAQGTAGLEVLVDSVEEAVCGGPARRPMGNALPRREWQVGRRSRTRDPVFRALGVFCRPLGGHTGPASCTESAASQGRGVLAREVSVRSGFLSLVVCWTCIHPFAWTLAQIWKTEQGSSLADIPFPHLNRPLVCCTSSPRQRRSALGPGAAGVVLWVVSPRHPEKPASSQPNNGHWFLCAARRGCLRSGQTFSSGLTEYN